MSSPQIIFLRRTVFWNSLPVRFRHRLVLCSVKTHFFEAAYLQSAYLQSAYLQSTYFQSAYL